MSIHLSSLLLLLAAAVLTVVLCRRLKLPAMLGYLLVGLLIGPHALGFIASSNEATHLAEFGVVFLMFTLGLEFNLARLNAMRRIVFGLGLMQVGAMLFTVMGICFFAGMDWKVGLALGGVLSMSSTAMASKLLADRNELHSPHGQNAIGILLFQDLAVVPFLVMIPVLSLPGSELLMALGLAAVKILVVLLVLLYFGQKLMRPWFNIVARQHSSELFMLNLLLVTLGIAWITELAGLSLALGAFLAGMLIAETDFRYQVEDDVRPFRDLLLGLFFVTVGMNLDYTVLLAQWWRVLLVLSLLGPGKILMIAALSRLFGSTPGAAWRTGFTIGQGGEFAFVMLALASKSALLSEDILQTTIAGIVLSMLITPFLIQHSDKLVLRLARSEWMNLAANLHQIAVRSMQQHGHVILCGYGRSGQSLARVLSQENIGFFALDLDPDMVREASAAGDSVVYGDAAKREVLIAAGLMRASAIVVTYAETHSAMQILEIVHSIRPELPVVIRTQDDSDIDQLKNAGATEVVAEIMEGSLMLASHTLMLLGVPLNKVVHRVREVREARYQLLRGFYRGVSEDADDSERPQPRLHTIYLANDAAAVGQHLGELKLENLNIEVRSVRRRNMPPTQPDASFELHAGDILVILGESDNLAAAEMRLLQGD
ncbi:monovalent cation:proton antiporter family protein [Iodobacter fluviatilis]|uniref:Kef-type potassium/proton antiporter (CPA2 family) n=1 Tax=Iodobacter fluviatilis TaxID=537 RepID=A0A377SVH7_9NEIS|nr:monovalent cation:proton antiporter family protein [Iodobacter fluviatilis]TCU85559.1 Kef-type potassium/proton antiporter (CPA2 family) [Iodobacter fluviatilis]STR44993.1 NEM-activable K(+)/H(+) antiporter [Iodobacter fluviatilis]